MSRVLPKGWVEVRLEDAVELLDFEREPVNSEERTKRLAGKKEGELYPYYGATGQAGWIDDFRSEGERVLLGEDGAPFLDPSRDKAYCVTGRFWVNNHAHVLQGVEALLDNRFLCHQLNTVDYQPHVSGSTRLKLTSSAMKRIPLVIAPRLEQNRIVEKLEELLSDLDAGVAELKAAQKKLALYRQSLLKAAVEGALTADWRTQRAAHGESLETGADLLARILTERRARWEARQLAKFEEQGKMPPKGWQAKYPEPVQPDTSDLSSLPARWIWASLDMLGEIVSGVAKGSKQTPGVSLREIAYLRVANVQRGFLDLTETKKIMASERDIEELTLRNGDVLFNEGGDRDKLGRGWVWRDEVAECIHQNHVFRMRPYLPEVLSEFVSHHGNTFGKSWFQQAGKQTTNLASINMGILRAFPVPVPPTDEAREILERVSQEIEAIKLQEASIELGLRQSTAQRKNLLKAAFSGRLVPQDPDDEPASALLARIRAEREERVSSDPARRKRRSAHA
ncbi:restriction endonuclease subunit S [Methyloversatilis universalis]|uniref:restriction endonuclease subunit S n=1 Tax=Methyloversatilis universalis TaxID=378211 RepID=UPI00039DB415|nr:restriction endonuclease subunit S [Methyloversatilis universalis]